MFLEIRSRVFEPFVFDTKKCLIVPYFLIRKFKSIPLSRMTK